MVKYPGHFRLINNSYAYMTILKKIYTLIFVLPLLIWGCYFANNHSVVYADLCNSSACTWINCDYTEYYDCSTVYVRQTCSRVVPQLCCKIEGSCTCCDNTGGCYINGCPSSSGDGGNDPPPPAGATATPTPVPGIIQARAVQVTPSDTSCTAVAASSTGISGTVFGFTASSANQPASKTQSGATAVSFTNQPVGWYTIDATPPNANWVLSQPCMSRNGALFGVGQTAYLNGGNTLFWDIGFTLGTAWVQTQGGDVYGAGSIRSYLPGVSPRVFSTVGTGGYPGIVTYGTSYDFESDSTAQGSDVVSSTNWLANATRTTVNYFDYFYRRYGSPTTADNESFINLAAVEQPSSRATPYYIEGDMTTSGDWSVGNDESIVFIVTGNLTLGGNINITGTGFVSFIVQGDIIVDSSVGTTSTSSTPVIEGIYIVSPTGTFQTGLSTTASTARFVGKGMFIAGNFLLQRDLDAYGENTNYSAELFEYNPQLLITMPDQMKELPVVWQEVAP